MFIKLGDYVIAINQIAFIKRIGAGCEVYLNDFTINALKIATVTDEEWEIALAKLFST
jgi:acid stress-induced BolA-like protein IbaG/YrbA